MMFSICLFVGLFFSILERATGDVMSIEYFENTNCAGTDLYGMQIQVAQCFRQVGAQGNGSAVVTCSDGGGLVVNEYEGSLDCSSAMTGTVTIATGFTSDVSCLTSPFTPNEYIPTGIVGNSIRINCAAAEEWFTAQDGRYELSRQTTSLESRSALDYTKDSCVENSLITEMNYCYINRNGAECLPTNSDSNNDSFCTNNALTTYAYGVTCLVDTPNSQYIQYWSDNNKAGYMNTGCGGIWDDQDSNVMPYSDCLGCNRFKDLKDDSSDSAMALLIAILIGVAVCCGVCCIGGIVFMYGGAALCGLCLRKNKNNNPDGKTEPFQSTTTTTPLHSPSYPQQQGQGQPGALELLTVQLPPNASSGMILSVTKSNGRQVLVN